MKIAIISDIHFGVNYGKGDFETYQRDYFNEFWREIDEREIKTLFFLGDFFHSRKMVNFDTLKMAYEVWFDPLKKRDMNAFMLLGNHDVFYKNTNSLNALELICRDSDIKIIKEPKSYEVHAVKYLFLPWINVENREQSIKALKESPANIVLSHLELQLDSNPHIQGQVGFSILERFSHVFSGHFHTPTFKTLEGGCQLRYLGSPYEMNWNDYGYEERGFYVFDDETFEVELVKNKKPIHFYHKLGEDIEWIQPWHSIRCIIPRGLKDLDYEVAMNALKKKQLMRIQMIAETEEVEEVEIESDGGDLDIFNVILKYAEANSGNLDGIKMRSTIEDLWAEIRE